MSHSGIEAAAYWMALSVSDLETADELKDRRPHIACYHSQQAAEKAVKSLYVAHQVPFPLTHSIAELIDGLAEAHPSLTKRRSAGVTLTLYEVHTRYVNLQTGINPLKEFRAEDADKAVQLATDIVNECQQIYAGIIRESGGK